MIISGNRTSESDCLRLTVWNYVNKKFYQNPFVEKNPDKESSPVEELEEELILQAISSLETDTAFTKCRNKHTPREIDVTELVKEKKKRSGKCEEKKKNRANENFQTRLEEFAFLC